MNSHSPSKKISGAKATRGWLAGAGWAISLVTAALVGLWGSGALDYMFKVNNTQEQVAAHKSDLSAIHTSVERLSTGNAVVVTKIDDIIRRMEHMDGDFDRFSDKLSGVEDRLGRIEGKVDALTVPPQVVIRH